MMGSWLAFFYTMSIHSQRRKKKPFLILLCVCVFAQGKTKTNSNGKEFNLNNKCVLFWFSYSKLFSVGGVIKNTDDDNNRQSAFFSRL